MVSRAQFLEFDAATGHFQKKKYRRLEYIQNNSERYNFATKIGNHGIITDPPAYVKALAEHVSERGGQFLQGTVKDFIISNHRLAGLKLSDDTRIECDECILATGKLF